MEVHKVRTNTQLCRPYIGESSWSWCGIEYPYDEIATYPKRGREDIAWRWVNVTCKECKRKAGR